MKTKKSTGIILATKPYFEKDKLVELFTPHLGKIRVLAKGAQSKSLRFAGRLEPTNLINCVLYQGKSFDILTHADICESFSGLRSDYNKIVIVMYFFDIIRHATMYHQNNKALFDLLYQALHLLEATTDTQQIRCFFQKEFLKIEGVLNSDYDTISNRDFFIHYETYSGKRLTEPVLI